MKDSSWWLRLPLMRPWTIIIGVLILTIVASIGAKNLYFRGDYKVFFEEDNPQRQAFEEMQNIFNKSENVAFLIVPETGSVFTDDTFSLIYELTEDAWQLPLSTRVESIANYQHTYAEQDDLIVRDLIESVDYSDKQVQEARVTVEKTPELIGRLVSRNHQVAVIDTIIQLPDGDQTPEVIEIASHARELQKKYEAAYPDHNIYLTGMVIMNDAFAVAAQEDASTLIPGMFLLIVILIAWFTRSVYAALFTFLIVILSIVVSMSIGGWFGIFLSTATVNAPTMITTLAVADCIHIIVGVRYFLSLGQSKHEAIASSVKINLRPIIITSVTTAIGFLMLNFAAVPVLSDLGNLTAVGVMLACALSLLLLPALLSLIPAMKVKDERGKNAWFTAFGEWVCTHYRRILPYSVLLIIGSLIFSGNNVLNDVAVKYFDDGSEFRQAVNKQESLMGGMSNIDFVIYTDESYGITKPEVLQQVDAFSKWLRTQPEVHHVLSFTDTMKRLSMNMHADAEAFYRLPESRELASQYLLLYEMSLPYGLDLNNQLDIDKSAIRIIARLDNLGSNEFTAFEERAKEWFSKLAPELRMEAASPPLMFAHIGDRNMRSMVWGSVLALILISLLLIFALRSWRLGLVSLLTNLIPAAVGFGIWGIVSGQINMALSVVLSMTMGIIVDDTVHFLSKYQIARQSGKQVADAVKYAFSTVGLALATTTVVLAAGFGVLTFSSFLLNADMGLLTMIIIVAALVIDLLFLPAFLIWLDKGNGPDGGESNAKT